MYTCTCGLLGIRMPVPRVKIPKTTGIPTCYSCILPAHGVQLNVASRPPEMLFTRVNFLPSRAIFMQPDFVTS